MEKIVKVSKDGSSIDFFQSDKIPISPKKFRSGPELEGFYRFIFENDLRKEALAIIDRIFLARKIKKVKEPMAAKSPTAAKSIAAKPVDLKPQIEKVIAKAATKKSTLASATPKVVPTKKAKDALEKSPVKASALKKTKAALKKSPVKALAPKKAKASSKKSPAKSQKKSAKTKKKK